MLGIGDPVRGGQIIGRLWPRSDEERDAALEAGYDLDEVLDKDRLVSGENVFFAATGVTEGDMLQGVHFHGGNAYTESISMRSRPARSAPSPPSTTARSCARSSRISSAGIRGRRQRAHDGRLQVEPRERAQEACVTITWMRIWVNE